MLADKKFREGIAVVGRLGLSYDVSLYHTQIGEVADLAAALPNTRIVVNHVGGVLGLGSYRSKQEQVFSRWAASIKALAARPNVFVKLGGLGQSYTALRLPCAIPRLDSCAPPRASLRNTQTVPFVGVSTAGQASGR